MRPMSEKLDNLLSETVRLMTELPSGSFKKSRHGVSRETLIKDLKELGIRSKRTKRRSG